MLVVLEQLNLVSHEEDVSKGIIGDVSYHSLDSARASSQSLIGIQRKLK